MYYVYITASISRVIYVGITSSLYNRIKQHKAGEDPKAFTTRYKVNRLVYYETYKDVYDAIEREKQIKRWSRKKKINLIESVNPKWNDLSIEPMFDKPSQH
ncbi:MAG TPA: GIY-YIG nuclease family protein [Balneolaceae bacterium]